jgi:hypothetical protein
VGGDSRNDVIQEWTKAIKIYCICIRANYRVREYLLSVMGGRVVIIIGAEILASDHGQFDRCFKKVLDLDSVTLPTKGVATTYKFLAT